MTRVAIVTDSTANLPPELAKAHDITVIPLNVHWGDETYQDGVTLDAEIFYQWLEARPELPTTSQPSVGAFIQCFQAVAERYNTDTILGTFISAEMSGTMSSAVHARAELPDLHIELVDSRAVTMGLGYVALAAARASADGAALEEVRAATCQARDTIEVLFTVKTLEYLRRGGRIGNAAHLLGTLLNLNPLMALQDGEVMALSKVRGRNKALRKILEEAERRVHGQTIREASVMYTSLDDDARRLIEEVRVRLAPKTLLTGTFSPVVGVHTGPGTLCLVIHP